MQIETRPLPLAKRRPLTVSRGTSAGSDNLLVLVTHEGVVGHGEFAPVSQADPPETADTARAALFTLSGHLEGAAPWEMQRVEALAAEHGTGRAALCALEGALHDW